MANPEHLARLTQGVSSWNAWRRDNRSERIDLSHSVLHQTRVPWEAGTLIQLDLEGANLRGTNLDWAIVKGANLRRADLSSATLRRADLRRSDLSGANLRAANLAGTNLTLASLRDANLAEALFWETVISRTDLRSTIGLDLTRHGGPSIIDHRTFRRSGSLPREFLLGVGLTDDLIRHFGSDKDAYSDCFISYSSRDEDFAEKLHSDLQRHGVRCWYAPRDLPIGAKTRQALDDAIRSNERLIVILSKQSIGSTWVEAEVETAFEEERLRATTVLMPVRIDDSVMQSSTAWASTIRTTRNIGDFTQWEASNAAYKRELDRLLGALKA
jgi:uncharacterized protein YjbI with pentapeptide repeats